MTESKTKLIAALMLVFMVTIAYYSMRNDSAIMDEVAHLPAGYSYITQQDMRINPEHPPLIKDLAGLGVWLDSKISGQPIKFPYEIKAWQTDVNGQWDFGFDLMYKEGNNAERMLFAGRLPMLLILLILGIYIFKWAKELWGKAVALLALFLFSFSPTFLAHGRFITTDVAAATAVFIATYYFLRWLNNPRWQNLILAGVIFGLAQLAKFSLFLLVPFFGFLVIVWIIIKLINQYPAVQKDSLAFRHLDPATAIEKQIMPDEPRKKPFKIIWRYISGLVIIFLIGYGLIVTPVYIFHIKNYPASKQLSDTEYNLRSYANGPPKQNESILSPCTNLSRISRCPAQLTIYLSLSPSLPARAFGQYMLGLVMVVQRASGGNTTYFMGEVTNVGWRSYFPMVYLLKEPLTLHVFTLIALLFVAYKIFKKSADSKIKEKKSFKNLIALLDLKFASFAMLVFIALYWATSINSSLNIGVRHVLPTFPLIYILVSSQVISWLRNKKSDSKILLAVKYGAVGTFVVWQIISVLSVYPSFLAYFNESVGGAKNGYKYAVDSNLDWGQDLKRLNIWIEHYNACAKTKCDSVIGAGCPKECYEVSNPPPQLGKPIDKIYVHYFGGATVEYYLGDKFMSWWGDRNPNDLKSGDWLAVSATMLQGGRGKNVKNFNQPTHYYEWLSQYQPITAIGHSIFVYQIP